MRSPLGRRSALTVLLVSVALVTGCAPTTQPDPAFVSVVGDLISSGRSAELGLTLDSDGRILPGTLTTLLDDMETEMADSVRSLELAHTSTKVDAEYRSDALSIGRDALDAVHLAQQGHRSAALVSLARQLDELSQLEDGG